MLRFWLRFSKVWTFLSRVVVFLLLSVIVAIKRNRANWIEIDSSPQTLLFEPAKVHQCFLSSPLEWLNKAKNVNAENALNIKLSNTFITIYKTNHNISQIERK